MLTGPLGCGKTAVLAAWLAKRRHAQSRKTRLISLNSQEEFVFWQTAGCSRQSTFVGHMLRRLMTEMKEHFALPREVPAHEGALTWNFPRFLEMAANKGRVILVIDGMARMQSDEGDSKLNWLPLKFPANVRVVLTSTDMREVTAPSKEAQSMEAQSPGSGGDSASLDHSVEDEDKTSNVQNTRAKIISEIERRGWGTVKLKHGMAYEMRAQVVVRFLTNSAAKADAHSADAHRGQGGQSGDSVFSLTTLSEEDGSVLPQLELSDCDLPGLTLFPVQIESIPRSPGARNPHFLTVPLKALQQSAALGLDLWRCLDVWIECRNLKELVSSVLDFLEKGQPSPDLATKESCSKRAREAGGFPALQEAHPYYRLALAKAREDASVTEGGEGEDLDEGEFEFAGDVQETRQPRRGGSPSGRYSSSVSPPRSATSLRSSAARGAARSR